jgi:hypothetical protein
MLISMQGNWMVSVKTKSAAFTQQFVINGAASGNGAHAGYVGAPSVYVTGAQWTISIQNDPGTGWRGSDMRVKFPTIVSGNYVFDIESNDSGSDEDFDDLILSCTTPVTSSDFLVYGHVSDYYGSCYFNPCWRDWLVIDSHLVFQQALKNPVIYEAIKQLYPERIPIKVNPNPPDPGPFKTMMIPVLGNQPMPLKTASVYTRSSSSANTKTSSKDKSESENTDQYSFYKNVVAQPTPVSTLSKYTYDKVSLGSIIDTPHLICIREDVTNQTLQFKEYDRSVSELAGGPYTGNGNKLDLGTATTDINGNYVFRFTQTGSELVNEILHDVAATENPLVQINPDVIVSIPDISGNPVYESAVYFNVPNLKRIDICLPKSVIKPARLCTTDNLITSVGLIPVVGAQNTGWSATVRDDGYTRYRTDGQITNHGGILTSPKIECGCWNGTLDLWGCLGNEEAYYYTIRSRQNGGSWNFVTDEFHCPRISIPDTTSPFNKVGPFFNVSLNVPGFGTGNVAHYTNIQRQHNLGLVDWMSPFYLVLIELNSGLYSTGPVDFRIDAYDNSGNQITSDLITLYIDNTPVVFNINDANFTTSVDSDCVLFALTDAEISQPLPLNVMFRANQANGFLQFYNLYMGKGKYNAAFGTTSNPAGVASQTYSGAYPTCSAFTGNADILSVDINGYSTIQLIPTGSWLNADQSFCTFTVDLSTQKRGTDGYGFDNAQGPSQFIFGIQRVNP